MSNSISHRAFHLFETQRPFYFALTLALLACGCTGSVAKPSPGAVAVAITPRSASLAIGATQQFSASVSGGSNSSVSWSVQCAMPGNSACGTISNAGLYTAPNTEPPPSSATVIATSQADPSQEASAAIALRQQVLAVAASPAQGMSASAALTLVHDAGARGQGVDLHWSAMEPAPGVYDFTTANQITTIQSQGPFRIHVTIGVITTTIRDVPADLATDAFDSTQMLTRFQNMLAALLNQFGSQINSIAIGNEVDVYLSANPGQWAAYATFYGQAAALVHTNYPNIRVGVTSTFGGATNTIIGPLIGSLNSVSDVFMMNYYPLNANYTPLDPSVVAGDFAKMLAASPNKPILLQEVGYPSSTALGSSEQLQSQFVQNVFAAWVNAGDKIPFLSFFLLHDDTPQVCQQIAAQFGVTDPNFALFFCSLGLRNSDGSDKLAWPALKTAAQADGFTALP